MMTAVTSCGSNENKAAGTMGKVTAISGDSITVDAFESGAQMPNGEKPENAPDGDFEPPRGEKPENLPDGEKPEMPDGDFKPPSGEKPGLVRAPLAVTIAAVNAISGSGPARNSFHRVKRNASVLLIIQEHFV